MTYLFVIQSIVWGLMIMVHVVFEETNFLRVGDLFWPDMVTHVWVVLVVVLGATMFYFLLRDYADRGKRRIWLMAKMNLGLWSFATMVWLIVPGGHILLFISILNVIGFSYIGLASREGSRFHRV